MSEEEIPNEESPAGKRGFWARVTGREAEALAEQLERALVEKEETDRLLLETCAELEQIKKDRQRQVKAIRIELAEVRKAMAGLDARRQDAERRADEQTKQAAEVAKQLEQARSEQLEHEKLTKRVEELEREREQLRGKASGVNDRLKKLTVSRDAAREQIRSLEKKLELEKQALTEQSGREESLRRSLREQEATKQAMVAELEELREACEEAVRGRNALDEQLEEQATEMARLQAELDARGGEQAEREQLRRQLNARDEELARLKETLTEREREASAVPGLRAELAHRRSALESLTAELEVRDAAHQALQGLVRRMLRASAAMVTCSFGARARLPWRKAWSTEVERLAAELGDGVTPQRAGAWLEAQLRAAGVGCKVRVVEAEGGVRAHLELAGEPRPDGSRDSEVPFVTEMAAAVFRAASGRAWTVLVDNDDGVENVQLELSA